MQPVLREGDYVLLLPWLRKPKLGKLVVVKHPSFGVIIKRVIGMDADGSFWLGSDDQSGVSTLQMGRIQPQQLLGRVVWKSRST